LALLAVLAGLAAAPSQANEPTRVIETPRIVGNALPVGERLAQLSGADLWNLAAKNSPGGCPIKGNISANGERIYHMPWDHSYAATRIDTRKGERWFCTEAKARAAGWRPAMK
jgi:hypothetical protein